jgi:hypothetical protein
MTDHRELAIANNQGVLEREREKPTREQAVAIRGQVDSNNLWALVGYNIQEARVLMGEAIVVLSPNNSSEEDVERSNLDAPLDFQALFNPFTVLGGGGAVRLQAEERKGESEEREEATW